MTQVQGMLWAEQAKIHTSECGTCLEDWEKVKAGRRDIGLCMHMVKTLGLPMHISPESYYLEFMAHRRELVGPGVGPFTYTGLPFMHRGDK